MLHDSLYQWNDTNTKMCVCVCECVHVCVCVDNEEEELGMLGISYSRSVHISIYTFFKLMLIRVVCDSRVNPDIKSEM